MRICCFSVAYNDAMRLLLQVPTWHGARQLFVSSGVPTCEALFRHSVYNITCCLDGSENSIIAYASRLRKHGWDSLHLISWTFSVLNLTIEMFIFFKQYVLLYSLSLDPLESPKNKVWIEIRQLLLYFCCLTLWFVNLGTNCRLY